MFDDAAPQVRSIIVNLWWEQLGASEFAMRAHVSSTVDGAPVGPHGAVTVDGVLEAVRRAVERFLASPPHGNGGAHG